MRERPLSSLTINWLDDQLGRRAAEHRKLHALGTLGVLRAASREGFLNPREALARLANTNFYVSQELIDKLLAETGWRVT